MFSDKKKYPYAKNTDKIFATKAPDFTLQTPEGNSLSLSSFKGKVLLVDFWASWCGPCRLTNPSLVKMYKELKGSEFEILGVSLDDNKDAWIKGINDDKLTWPQVSEMKRWDADVVADYGISSIPQSVVVDKEGYLVAKIPGQRTPDATIAEIRSFLTLLLD